jgi:hypothetical protein
VSEQPGEDQHNLGDPKDGARRPAQPTALRPAPAAANGVISM